MTKRENRQKLMNELARLFNANSGKKIGDACRGDWKGRTDYSVKFDNNEKFYISNGMKYFDEVLQREIDTFTQFNKNKQSMVNKLLEMQETDNINATERGLNKYKIIDLEYAKNGTYIGWFYLTIIVNGIKKNMCETNLNCAVSSGIEKLIDYVNGAKSDRLKIAGNLLESEVDFIFNGYGFCSTSDSYTLEL